MQVEHTSTVRPRRAAVKRRKKAIARKKAAMVEESGRGQCGGSGDIERYLIRSYIPAIPWSSSFEAIKKKVQLKSTLMGLYSDPFKGLAGAVAISPQNKVQRFTVHRLMKDPIAEVLTFKSPDSGWDAGRTFGEVTRPILWAEYYKDLLAIATDSFIDILNGSTLETITTIESGVYGIDPHISATFYKERIIFVNEQAKLVEVELSSLTRPKEVSTCSSTVASAEITPEKPFNPRVLVESCMRFCRYKQYIYYTNTDNELKVYNLDRDFEVKSFDKPVRTETRIRGFACNSKYILTSRQLIDTLGGYTLELWDRDNHNIKQIDNTILWYLGDYYEDEDMNPADPDEDKDLMGENPDQCPITEIVLLKLHSDNTCVVLCIHAADYLNMVCICRDRLLPLGRKSFEEGRI